MRVEKYFCDVCKKEIPYVDTTMSNGKPLRKWFFGKLNFISASNYYDADYEICEECADKFNALYSREQKKLMRRSKNAVCK